MPAAASWTAASCSSCRGATSRSSAPATTSTTATPTRRTARAADVAALLADAPAGVSARRPDRRRRCGSCTAGCCRWSPATARASRCSRRARSSITPATGTRGWSRSSACATPPPGTPPRPPWTPSSGALGTRPPRVHDRDHAASPARSFDPVARRCSTRPRRHRRARHRRQRCASAWPAATAPSWREVGCAWRARRPASARPLAEGCDVTGAEILYAVRHEVAITLADALLRRTEAGTAGHPGRAALEAAAAIMAAGARLGRRARVAAESRRRRGACTGDAPAVRGD